MAQAFAEEGHEVMLVAPAGDITSGVAAAVSGQDDGAPFGFRSSFRTVQLSRTIHRGQSFINAVRIARIARRTRPDLVFSRDLRGCLIPALRGIPTVYEAHSLTMLDRRIDRWVLRRLLRTAAFRGIVAISGSLRDDLASVLAIETERIHVAHDAVRRASVHSVPKPARSTPALRVGYVGSLFAGRGVELLVDVTAGAAWLELHLVGGPTEAIPAWMERIPDDIRPQITFHGQVAPARARELQAGFDVLVAPYAHKVSTDSGVDTSRWMSPMKVFEYMASGVPIVISDLPVLREVLRPDVDALMVTPEDPEALLVALERLRDDPALGRRLAASALERVLAEFTWDQRARHILGRFLPEVPTPE